MLVVMVGSLLNLTSCSSDDDGGGSGNAGAGTIVAKVDGASFESLEISSGATIANGGLNLIMIGTNIDAQGFSLAISGYDGVGSYSIGGGTNIFNTVSYTETMVNLDNPTASTTEVWSAPYNDQVVGELRVSEQTETTITGTFEFTCKNPTDDSIKTVTEGSFNLEFDIIN